MPNTETGKYWQKAWTPITGCTPLSEGCQNCWAREMHERFHGAGSFAKVTLHEDGLTAPLHWRKPKIVFADMCDPFHEDVPDEFLDRMVAVAALCARHRFLWLTKRSRRMREYWSGLVGEAIDRRIGSAAMAIGGEDAWAYALNSIHGLFGNHQNVNWPPENLWLGVTCENQQAADERIPDLLATPAAHRWLSLEPLLEAVELFDVDGEISQAMQRNQPNTTLYPCDCIDWVVVGGESGSKARPCNVEWIRSIVRQCKAAGVPVWVKQLGSNPLLTFQGENILKEGPDKLRDRTGRDMSEWPADLRIRQLPEGLQ